MRRIGKILKWFAIVSGCLAIAVIAIALLAAPPQSQADLAAVPTARATPPTQPMPPESAAIPDAEGWAISVVTSYVEKYEGAPNDMVKGKVRSDRAKELCGPNSPIKSARGAVKDWIGTVETLDSTNDGRGILAVKIARNVTLKTTNNTFSEGIGDTPTLIAAGTPLFNAASSLSSGQTVRFSGNFWPGAADCMVETSLTPIGAMKDPEFLFRFTAVAPAQ